MQINVNDNKLNTTDTSNIKSDFEVWFRNKSVNKTDLDSEEKQDSDEDESNIEVKERRIK